MTAQVNTQQLNIGKFDGFVLDGINIQTKAVADIKINKGTSRAVDDAILWIMGPPKTPSQFTRCCQKGDVRKCRDWICLSVFLVCALFVVLCGFTFPKSKISNFTTSAANYLTPSDELHRICGESTAKQVDKVAVNYDRIIKDFGTSIAFCHFLKNMSQVYENQTFRNQRITEVGAQQDYAVMSGYDCNSLLVNKNQPTNVSKENYNSTESHAFYNKISKLYANMTYFDLGYQGDSIVCVNNMSVDDKCQPGLTVLGKGANYICHREVGDLVELILFKDFNGSLDGYDKYTSIIRDFKAQVKKYEDMFSAFPSFISQDMYDALVELQKIVTPDLNLVELFCQTMPTQIKLTNYWLYKPKTFHFDTFPKCTTNLENVKGKVDGSSFVFVYISYLFNAIFSPISAALYEMDNAWASLLQSVAISAGLSLAFQVLCVFLTKPTVYLTVLIIGASLMYYIYKVLAKCLEASVEISRQMETTGTYDMSQKLVYILLIIVVIVMVIALVMVAMISCMLWSLAFGIQQATKVALNVVKKTPFLFLMPFLVLAIVLLLIVGFMLIIVPTSAAGEYNAATQMFVLTNPSHVILMIFYLLMIIHIIFLCVLTTDYFTGAAVIQYYFLWNKKGREKKFFTSKALQWMLLQFGSLAFEALCYMFMIWFRPIFMMIVEKNPLRPKSPLMAKVVAFSRQYVSLCQLKTTFCLALTGDSLLNAAKKYRTFMYEEDAIGSAVSEVINSFLEIMSYNVTLLTLIINTDSNYIWIQIIQFMIGFLVASVVSELVDNIIKANLFCLNYEQGCGGRVLSEPKEFNQLRSITQKSRDKFIADQMKNKANKAKKPKKFDEDSYSYSYYSDEYSYYSSESGESYYSYSESSDDSRLGGQRKAPVITKRPAYTNAVRPQLHMLSKK